MDIFLLTYVYKICFESGQFVSCHLIELISFVPITTVFNYWHEDLSSLITIETLKLQFWIPSVVFFDYFFSLTSEGPLL